MIKIIKTKSLYSSIYETVEFCKLNENEKIEIIVPDKLTLFMEKFLFEKMNLVSSFNIKVSSFNRFAKKNLEIDKDKQISKIGSLILINKILNDNSKSFKSLKNKNYTFSYAEEIFKTISQLKSSKIGYEEMKNFSSSNTQLVNKIKDLSTVYEQYEILKAGKLDSSDLFLSSTLFVSQNREDEKIVFVGFDDFTAIEYSIIEQLAKVCDVTIMDMFSQGENQAIYNQEIYSQIKNIAYINNLKFDVQYSNLENSHLKSFLEDNLFSLNNKKCVIEDEIVQLYSAKSETDEIEFVARDIRKNILEGDSFSKFGVAVYDLPSRIGKIKEIFEKYEINYYIDNPLTINKSILFKFFVSIFKYNFEYYNQSHLIDIINSPFFCMDNSTKKQLIDKLLSYGFNGLIDDSFSINIDDDVRKGFVEFFKKLNFGKSLNAQEVVDFFKNLFDKLEIDKILDSVMLQTEIEDQIVLSKSKEVIINLFDEFLSLYKNGTKEELFDVFNNISTVVEINNLPLTLDCVKIVDAEDCKEIFDELYVINCTKNNAPRLKYDCGIILDKEIEELNFSNKLSPTISHINKLSKMRLFNLILMFENALTISYFNLPSEIIIEIKNRLKVNVDCAVLNLPILANKDYDKYLILSKWDFIQANCKNLKSLNFFNKNYENIIENKKLNQISNDNLKIFENLSEISSSNLENYFKCPFNNFLNRTLKIQPRLDTDLLSFDVGNILHNIMCEYYKKNKKVDDVYDFCKQEVLNYVNSDERLKFSASKVYVLNLIDEAVRSILKVENIDINSNFVNLYQEFEFKNKTAYKLKNINLIGKVDRVDVCGDMFRIIDYKSGKVDLGLDEIYYGKKLQLFLYANAMQNVIKKNFIGCFYLPLHNDYIKEDKIIDLQGYFLNENFVLTNLDKSLSTESKSKILGVNITKDGIVGKNVIRAMDSQQLIDIKSYVNKVSEQAVLEIKSGYISPSPLEKDSSCDYCPYKQICFVKSSNLEYRQIQNVNVESFKEVDCE